MSEPLDIPKELRDTELPNHELPKGGPEWWRRTFVYLTGLGLTEDEKVRWERDYRARRAVKDCQNCEKWKNYLMDYSPIVRFMREKLQEVGGDMPKDKVVCAPCNELRSGGFNPEHGIMLCSNYLLGQNHAEDTLAHEMVHAYDYLRFKVNWEDLKHHACSEIRASSLSGECRWTREAFGRGIWDFTAHHQACVRRRATISVRQNPKCESDEMAAKVVNQVFESCFADTRPFDEIYR